MPDSGVGKTLFGVALSPSAVICASRPIVLRLLQQPGGVSTSPAPTTVVGYA